MSTIAKYRPPADVPLIDGLSPSAQEQLRSWIKQQFTQVAEDLGSVTRTDSSTLLLTDTRIDVPAGAKRRVSPSAAGMVAVLEAPSPANAGEEIVLFLEDPRGTLTIASSPGIDDGGQVFLPLINGDRQATFSIPGAITLRSNGSNSWTSVSSFSAEAVSRNVAAAAETHPWDQVLADGAHSGAHTPIIDRGSALNFATGATGITADADLLVNVGSALTMQSGTDMHLHPDGQLHLGHETTTSSIHQGALGDIDVVTSAAYSVSSTGNASVTAGGNVPVSAGGFFSLGTGSVTRIVIDTSGAWNLAGTDPGTAGKYFRSAGIGAPPVWANIAYSELPTIASDTFLGNVSGSVSTPVAVNLSTLAGAGLVFGTHTLDVTAGAGGSIVVGANDVQRAALTGDVTASQDSNATTIAAHAVTNGKLAQMANDTFKGNVSGGTADPSDVALSTLAGNGLGFASHTLSVNVGPSLAIATDNVVRAALTGAITASQDSNTTAFGALAAKSVLANATNASAVPAALAGSSAFQHLRVNSANTGLEWSVLTTGDFPANSVPLTALATEAADTFVGNITALTATPIAVPLANIDSVSVIYDATSHTFQRAAMTGAIVSAQNSNATVFQNVSPGSFIGLQVDAVGAASAIEITGTEAGENIRFGTAQNDTTTTGVVNAYALNANTTQVVFGAGAGTITLNGIAAPTSFAEGREVTFIFDSGYTGNLSVVNLAGTASVGNKITTGNGITTTFLEGDSFTARYEASVWRITALARRVPQYQVNAGTAAAADICNISSGTGIAVTGAVTSGSATYSVGLASVASDTVKGNISGSSAVATDVSLLSLGSSSIFYATASHTFIRPALTGPIAAAQNSNALAKTATVCALWDDFFAVSSGTTTGAAFFTTTEAVWQFSAIIGTTSWTSTGASGHPGQVTIATSSAINDRWQLQLTASDSMHSHDISFMEANFSCNSGATSHYFFGFQSSGTANHIAYFEFNSGTNRCVSDNGSGTPQTTALTTTITNAQTYRIEYNGTSMLFYINGTLVATHSTKVPNATGQFFFLAQTLTTAARSMTIDYFSLQSQSLSR